jgi:hypothetical protein
VGTKRLRTARPPGYEVTFHGSVCPFHWHTSSCLVPVHTCVNVVRQDEEVVPETGPGRDLLRASRRTALWHVADDLSPDCRRATLAPGCCVGDGSDCLRGCGRAVLSSPWVAAVASEAAQASNRGVGAATAHCLSPVRTRGGAFAAPVLAAATDVVFQKRDHG